MTKGPRGEKRPADVISTTLWSMEDVIAMMDAKAEAPKKRAANLTKACKAKRTEQNSNWDTIAETRLWSPL